MVAIPPIRVLLPESGQGGDKGKMEQVTEGEGKMVFICLLVGLARLL